MQHEVPNSSILSQTRRDRLSQFKNRIPVGSAGRPSLSLMRKVPDSNRRGCDTLLFSKQARQTALPTFHQWRKMRDSNPQTVSDRQFSRLVHSPILPIFQCSCLTGTRTQTIQSQNLTCYRLHHETIVFCAAPSRFERLFIDPESIVLPLYDGAIYWCRLQSRQPCSFSLVSCRAKRLINSVYTFSACERQMGFEPTNLLHGTQTLYLLSYYRIGLIVS